MLNPRSWTPAEWPDAAAPLLIVTIDTEEEFDWFKPFSRASVGVDHIRDVAAADRLFERFQIKPTYLVAYPVASQDAGFKPLRELAAAGRCDIGAHLHPWVNPPFEEEISPRHSFPGNLPPALEREKLRRLTETIGENLGVAPRVYRAGRYGVGAASTGILEELGFEIDTSVVPQSDFRAEFGPDFRHCGIQPYWFGGRRRLLEIPLTVGWCGMLRWAGGALYQAVNAPLGRRYRLGGILARLRLFERVRLSPEGANVAELKRLTATLLASGHRLFNFSFHSPSLAVGHTPYVRRPAELAHFRATIEAYFDYFFGQVGGRPATPATIRGLAAVGSES